MNKKNGNKNAIEMQEKNAGATPAARLTALYSQMQAAGHGPDHKWCLELAGIIAAIEDAPQSPALPHAIDAVNISDIAMSFVQESMQPVLVAIEALARFDSTDFHAYDQRMGEIQALARVGRRIGEDAINTIDCEREDARDKLAALKGAQA